MLSSKRMLASLAVAFMMTNHVSSMNSLPNWKEAMLGPNSSQYFMGTTTDIVAVVELGYNANFFFTSDTFWIGFLAAMQVDVTNF